MNEISPRKNLVYSSLPGETLFADLYLPSGKESRQRYSVVIFIHGAVPKGIAPKDWGVYISWGKLIAASGMAAVTFNHRLLWNDGYEATSLPVAATDVENLIRYIRDNSADLGLDPDRVCIAVFSAGGVLLAAPIRQNASHVRCLVGFYPYLGDPLPADSADAGRFSPLSGVKESSGKLPPIFIAKAGLDWFELNKSVDTFVKAYRARGSEVVFAEHPVGHHGFDTLDDDETSREIIRRAVEFVKHHL